MTRSAKTKKSVSHKWQQMRESKQSTSQGLGLDFPLDLPKVSVVIPSYNCAHSIGHTLDSILAQEYPNIEVIVIDANSNDRTLACIKHYPKDRIQVHSVAQYKLYDMLNWGISLATGRYINFLVPGDFYVGKYAMLTMMELALAQKLPDMVYCATLLRKREEGPRILYRRYNKRLLRNGQQPTSLESCWYKTQSLRLIGKFDRTLRLRGGFDLFCRFLLDEQMRYKGTSQVLTDYATRKVSYLSIARHFWENMRIIRRHFGRRAVLRWLTRQKDVQRALIQWGHQLRLAFLGR